MRRLSETILGKILSYSDNCCAAGVNKSFLLALARCVDSNPENTLTIRAIGLIKVLRYIAGTNKNKLFNIFLHFIDPRLDGLVITSNRIVSGRTCDWDSGYTQEEIHEGLPAMVAEERKLLMPNTIGRGNSILPVGTYMRHDGKITMPKSHMTKSKAHLLFDTDLIIDDQIYSCNERIIDDYMSNMIHSVDCTGERASMSILVPLPSTTSVDTKIDTITDANFSLDVFPRYEPEYLVILKCLATLQLDKLSYPMHITHNKYNGVGNYDSTNQDKRLVRQFIETKEWKNIANTLTDKNTIVSFDNENDAKWIGEYTKKYKSMADLIDEYKVECSVTYSYPNIEKTPIKILHFTSQTVDEIKYWNDELEYDKFISTLGGMFVEEETNIFDILREQFKSPDDGESEIPDSVQDSFDIWDVTSFIDYRESEFADLIERAITTVNGTTPIMRLGNEIDRIIEEIHKKQNILA